jgi:GR25 family glycosyltransferase involved in LPS biosynthesis
MNSKKYKKSIKKTLKYRKTKQKGGDIIYIKKAYVNENEYIYPILKNMYPNNKIEFTSDENKFDLEIKSNWSDEKSSNKYIFTSGENYDNTKTYSYNDPNCIANIVSSKINSHTIKNYYYIPFFLNIGPTISESSPFIRKYTNNTRNNLAAYIATHSTNERNEFFTALSALDTTVHGLGKANNNIENKIPPRSNWWDLLDVYKDYKFGFAMENKNEDGYITEKIMNIYRSGAIPLYWGTAVVKEIFHPDSFIYLNDYPSLSEAAKDVVAISKDENRMNIMYNAPIFKENINPDYSKYYDNPSPQWVIDIGSEIKNRLLSGGNKKELVVQLSGGLGNRLFQIFAGYGFAEKWNMDIILKNNGKEGNHVPDEESKNQIKSLFNNITFIEDNKDISNYTRIGEKEEFVYNTIDNPNNNVVLDGFFQSEKYFPTHPLDITLNEPVNNLIKDIDKNKLFFIHFRLGDYVGNKNVNYSMSNNKIDKYYKTCIKKIKDTYNDPIFIIITNDKNTVKNYINDQLSNDLSGNQIIYTDDSNSLRLDSLYYMSQCKGGIAVNSTFSWFGTYLIKNNDKNFIFMLKPWFTRFDPNKQYDVYPSWATLINIDELEGGNKLSKGYVINLDDRTDRWESTQEYFNNSSIELERISAIKNENGHLGCGLSIQKIIQMAKDQNMNTVLILEDDNKPCENFDMRWQTVKKWLDENMDVWDVFNGSAKLGENHDESHVRLKHKLENNVNLFEGDYILNTNWLYVNRSVYDIILTWTPDVIWAIDRFVGDIKFMKNLFIFPFLSLQDNGASNTNSYTKNYDDENNRRIEVLNRALAAQKGGKRKTRKQKGGNKKLIIKSYEWSGFFSNFNKLITYLVDHPTISHIDFHMKSSAQGLPFAFIKEGEELFSKLFETYNENKDINEILEKEKYENEAITGKKAVDFYNENRNKLQPFHDAYKKYIKIKENIQNKIDEKLHSLKEGNPEQIIAIFVRSEALRHEQPNGNMPTQEDYKKVIDSIDKRKSTKYFLCVDNNSDLEYYKEHFKPNYHTNIRRTSNNKNGEPHRNTMGTLEELENSFIEVVLLSHCHILVHCVSNMATASLYMNMDQISKFVQSL